jgi:hypothetical protein
VHFAGLSEGKLGRREELLTCGWIGHCSPIPLQAEVRAARVCVKQARRVEKLGSFG